MSVVKLKWALLGAILISGVGPANAQTWQSVDQTQQLANSWSEVTCDDGDGYQKCEQGAPVEECRSFQRNVYHFHEVTKSKAGWCRGGDIYWAGQLIVGSTDHRNNFNTHTVNGYRYYVQSSSPIQYDSGQCSGRDPGGVRWRGVCRIRVE